MRSDGAPRTGWGQRLYITSSSRNMAEAEAVKESDEGAIARATRHVLGGPPERRAPASMRRVLVLCLSFFQSRGHIVKKNFFELSGEFFTLVFSKRVEILLPPTDRREIARARHVQ